MKKIVAMALTLVLLMTAAMAFADNAMQVNADAVARYSALVKAGDDFDPMALGLMVLVFSISSLSAVFIRRRNK